MTRPLAATECQRATDRRRWAAIIARTDHPCCLSSTFTATMGNGERISRCPRTPALSGAVPQTRRMCLLLTAPKASPQLLQAHDTRYKEKDSNILVNRVSGCLRSRCRSGLDKNDLGVGSRSVSRRVETFHLGGPRCRQCNSIGCASCWPVLPSRLRAILPFCEVSKFRLTTSHGQRRRQTKRRR